MFYKYADWLSDIKARKARIQQESELPSILPSGSDYSNDDYPVQSDEPIASTIKTPTPAPVTPTVTKPVTPVPSVPPATTKQPVIKPTVPTKVQPVVTNNTNTPTPDDEDTGFPFITLSGADYSNDDYVEPQAVTTNKTKQSFVNPAAKDATNAVTYRKPGHFDLTLNGKVYNYNPSIIGTLHNLDKNRDKLFKQVSDGSINIDDWINTYAGDPNYTAKRDAHYRSIPKEDINKVFNSTPSAFIRSSADTTDARLDPVPTNFYLEKDPAPTYSTIADRVTLSDWLEKGVTNKQYPVIPSSSDLVSIGVALEDPRPFERAVVNPVDDTDLSDAIDMRNAFNEQHAQDDKDLARLYSGTHEVIHADQTRPQKAADNKAINKSKIEDYVDDLIANNDTDEINHVLDPVEQYQAIANNTQSLNAAQRHIQAYPELFADMDQQKLQEFLNLPVRLNSREQLIERIEWLRNNPEFGYLLGPEAMRLIPRWDAAKDDPKHRETLLNGYFLGNRTRPSANNNTVIG